MRVFVRVSLLGDWRDGNLTWGLLVLTLAEIRPHLNLLLDWGGQAFPDLSSAMPLCCWLGTPVESMLGSALARARQAGRCNPGRPK